MSSLATGNELERLKKIEGQVRGIQRMIQEDRYCPDILNQMASVKGAIEKVKEVFLRKHLERLFVQAGES